MTETTAVMSTDLDLLAERVERAASLVQQLRTDNLRLTSEREEFTRRMEEAEAKLEGAEKQLQGQDVTALLGELTDLRRLQRDWQSERRDVATKIEGLLKKLDRLEG